MNRYLIICLILLFINIVSYGQENSSFIECNDCKRNGYLVDVSAYDPVNIYGFHTGNDGKLTSNGERALFDTYLHMLAEHSSNCFRLQAITSETLDEWQKENSDLQGIGSKWSLPEYGFKIDIETGLPGVEAHPVNERPVVSSLKVLMYFLGEEEELVHTWTALGTLNTDRTGQTTQNGLDNQLEGLLKNGQSYHAIASDFEKRPRICTVSSDKQSADRGEEIEITISDLRDAKGQTSREFNRIIVHASEGKILNGEKSELGSEYRVFRLDEVSVRLKYKAPDQSEASSDRITVYNSCDILPVDKVPLRDTRQGDRINTYDLILTHYDWTGTIDLEITHTYICDAEEPTSNLSTKRILADDHKTTSVNISIGLSDFNLPATGSSAGAKLQHISGQVTVTMHEEHTVDGSSNRTQCHNDGTGRWEWVSPGNWNTQHETMAGQAYADIEDGGLTLLIAKEMLGDKEAMDNMQQQMAEMQARLQAAYNSKDKQAMENMKGEMRNMVQGDRNNATIPIKAVINISFGARNYPVYTSRVRKAYNVCTGEYEENESRSETIEVPLILPFGAEMKGEYTSGRDGNDRIEATIEETKPFSAMFGSGTSCPEGTITIKGNITLERNKN
jgi:hypothetical protein